MNDMFSVPPKRKGMHAYLVGANDTYNASQEAGCPNTMIK